MKNAIASLPEAERLAFYARKSIRDNIARLGAAMSARGILSVMQTARVKTGRCLISPDVDWRYRVEPEQSTFADVEIGSAGAAGETILSRTSLRAALAQVFGNIIEDGFPDWRGVEKAEMALKLAPGEAILDVRGQGPDGSISHRAVYEADIDHFMALTPVLETETGAWYRVETDADAVAASRLSRTAIAQYFRSAGNGAHAQWFVHAEFEGANPVAGVALVAQSAEDFDPDRWPHGSHVTGFANSSPYPGHAAEIEALAAAVGLHIEPNWMGNALADTDETPSP